MNKRRKKYIKFNHKTLYTKFLIKKLHYIQKGLHAELNILHQIYFFSPNQKNFTRNTNIFTQNILHQTDGTFGLPYLSLIKL